MFSTATGNWLYNGSGSPHADLDYFMGYTICKSYYRHHADKRQSIKKIIELNHTGGQQATDFFKAVAVL